MDNIDLKFKIIYFYYSVYFGWYFSFYFLDKIKTKGEYKIIYEWYRKLQWYRIWKN